MTEPLRLDYAVNDREVIAAFKRQQAEFEREKKARQDLQAQIKENAKAEADAAKQAMDAAKAVAAQQAKLAADASKVAESVRTPIETYRDGLRRLLGHLTENRLSSEQYRRAVEKLKGAYNDATGKTEAMRRAQAAENAEMAEAEAITKRVMTADERYAAAVAKLTMLRDKGRMSSEVYSRAMAQEKAALSAATPPAQSLSSRFADLAKTTVDVSGAMAAGYKVVEVLREEYDRLIQRQEKAAGVQISLAAAQESALGNLDQSMTPQDFLQAMRDQSNRLGISEQQLTIAAADALSAKGDKYAVDAIGAVVAAAQFKRFGSASEQANLAGTALDFAKAFRMTPEESLGFLAQSQKLARVTTAEGMSENIAPALMGANQFGVDRNVASAVAAALTSGSADKTGAQTKTTMAALFEQLRSFADGGTAEQALFAVQNSDQLRQEFLSNASFEKAMIASVESLLTPGTQGFNEFANARQQLQTMTPQQAYDEEISKKLASSAIAVAMVDQRAANVAEQQQLLNPQDAISGVIRKRLAESRDALGQAGISARMSGIVDDFISGGMQTPETMIAALEGERTQILQKQAVANFGRPIPGAFIQRDESDLTPAEKMLVDLLKQQIEQFKAMSEILKQAQQVQHLNRQAGVMQNRAMLQGEAGR